MAITLDGTVGITAPSYNMYEYPISNTAYTLQLGDNGKILEFTGTGAVTITVPTNASVGFPIGTQIVLFRYTNKEVAITNAVGVTIRSSEGKLRINKQYELATLAKIDTDEWFLVGSLKT